MIPPKILDSPEIISPQSSPDRIKSSIKKELKFKSINPNDDWIFIQRKELQELQAYSHSQF